ncbi:Stress responsive A/B Barrel Domain [Pseudarcicella hirudinis]|uniref:Stress responsive A/B Barrel Domain n=1 Tax=Pseudarcicella hirudinis TaxID=1079859 RepID=A0A1I5VH87_9BACT|nr:Dabb family protein [Pseudarcicella hirudinis]SFQ06850.1 Stress responsive A/B Barrel Domain [Pseudarcicella hirudinis]
MFVHVVNFWLKDGLSAEDRRKFEVGVSSLGNIEGVVTFNVGKPAATNRPVIDRSYDYCLLTTFENESGHDYYQIAPVHLKFIEECNHLWERVLIYDSESI